MNFFEHQELARRNSRRLVWLYLLAVVAVVVAVDIVIAGVYLAAFADPYAPVGRTPGLFALLRTVPAEVYVTGAAAAAALILGVSAYHVTRLREGGEAIARMAGARPVAPDTRDFLERRLLNVVEEMAIAAGMRVPKVFVMDEERGINAFAAGYDVSGAVVAVTRGALETLNREELQGVIGHEFSHIVNGDMQLNIRMMGVLGGIVFIGAVGAFVMRGAGRGRRGSGGIFLAGIALFIVGYTGLFFARMIKAAVSRQREFLADASSVQFTRNPDGIAGALDQISASARGTLVANRYAEDMSHMYFGQAVGGWLAGLFATHPALDERIRRVRPGFERVRYRETRAQSAADAPEVLATAPGLASAATSGRRTGDAGRAWTRSSGESVALVGTLDSSKVTFARRLLRALPPGLRERIAEVECASAVLVGLMLAPKENVLEGQLAAARAAGVQSLVQSARALAPELHRLGPAFRFPLVDLALPALKAAPAAARQSLLTALEAVTQADRRVSLPEFVLLTLVRSQLERPAQPAPIRFKSIADVRTEAITLLSLLAHAGRRSGLREERDFEDAFSAGAREMGLAPATPLGRDALAPDAARTALETLTALAPLAKAVVVKGMFAAATFDGSIRLMEAELMRLIGAVLDCPLPPLLDELDPATLA